MILGVGTDLVEVPRVEALLARHGDRFARRVLAEVEWPAYEHSVIKPIHLASRFAAKEAFAKALGTGVRAPASLHNIAVTHDASGRPVFSLAPALAALMQARGIGRSHLSITHERSIACAFVVLEQE
ncbi:MAG: holo-ACP synthase [Burkholderiales bacterium]|nr:holo-ACP synthase [Burkholderiales bacterium]